MKPHKPSLTLPAELHRSVQIAAQLDGLSVAQWVTRALVDSLPRYDLAPTLAAPIAEPVS